ncbi:MAG: sodium:solute symporter family protein [Candidatus Thermoplasmatota archaeon]|nr:sodium:solute symporter family protein [Candidatus Thermoplasmatota archaeon]
MDISLTLGILIGYLAVLIGVGLYTHNKIGDEASFFLANRTLGSFTLTATITATVVGGSATIASAALIYRNGLPGLWLDIGGGVGLIILAGALAKLIRKTGLFTLPEITGYLFDQKTRYAAAVLVFLTQIAWIALLIQGTAAILSVLLPYDYVLILVGITCVFIVYTIIGGQFAVVYTDIIQFIVMIIGICVLAAPLLFWQALPHFATIPSRYLQFPINSSLGVLPVLSFFFMMMMPHIVGPDIYNKLLSARDEKSARKGAFFSGIFKLIFAGAIGIIGISAVVLVPGLSSSESIFALPRAVALLHPVLAGIILAAMISVMLSSADSVLISSGAVFSIDLLRKKNINYSRVGLLVVGFGALGLALYLDDIIATLQFAYTVFTAGLTLPIIFGFYKHKTHVSNFGALLGLVCGGSVALLWLVLESPYINAVLVGLIVSLIPLLLFRK